MFEPEPFDESYYLRKCSCVIVQVRLFGGELNYDEKVSGMCPTVAPLQ